jgi:putative flavoprotein involved in K+ transport
MVDLGLMDATLESLETPEARVAGNVTVSGAHGGVDCSPLLLEAMGASLHGRLVGFRAGEAEFADDLAVNLDKGATFERELCRRMDKHVREYGLDIPPEAPPCRPLHVRDADAETRLDMGQVGSVLWANGYRPGFRWIDLPVFDDLGFPHTKRGVTSVPGLMFLGLPWLYRRRSSLLLGVGDDARHVAHAVASHLEKST